MNRRRRRDRTLERKTPREPVRKCIGAHGATAEIFKRRIGETSTGQNFNQKTSTLIDTRGALPYPALNVQVWLSVEEDGNLLEPSRLSHGGSML